MEQKKKRGENWTSEEKIILRTLIAQVDHIIEDKSTKTSVNMQKIKEWKNITNKFNEITGKCRTDGELKLAWKRIKLSAKSNIYKKSLSNIYTYRREQLKTGSGEKPPSPSPEDLEIMVIAPHDFVVEVNDYNSDAVNIVTAATTSKEIFADPKPSLGFEKTDPAIVINVENPEPDVVEVQEIDPTTDAESAKMVKITNNKTVNTGGITKTRNKKKGLQYRREDILQKIIKSNTDFKKRHLEMMEEEHKYNVKIANLKIRKLELQISLLENQKNTS